MGNMDKKMEEMVEDLFQNTDIVSQLLNENLDELYEEVESEMVMDVIDMKLNSYTTPEIIAVEQMKYGLKYALLITRFEFAEEFEKCAFIKNAMVMAYRDIYGLGLEESREFFNIVTTAAREILSSIDDLTNRIDKMSENEEEDEE